MAGYINVDAAINESRKLLKEKSDVLKKIDIVRTDLRNAAELGDVSDAQRKYITETFPKRERKSKNKA